MAGVTIIDVKIVGMCSKCRKEGDEIKKDLHGRVYEDKEISCIGCAIGSPIKKKWMRIDLSENAILLHHNEELEQYKHLPRVTDELIKQIKETQGEGK